MGRISLVEQYDNKTVIAQILRLFDRTKIMTKRITVNGDTYSADENGDVDLGILSSGAGLVDHTTYYTLQIFDTDLISLTDEGTYYELYVSSGE